VPVGSDLTTATGLYLPGPITNGSGAGNVFSTLFVNAFGGAALHANADQIIGIR